MLDKAQLEHYVALALYIHAYIVLRCGQHQTIKISGSQSLHSEYDAHAVLFRVETCLML